MPSVTQRRLSLKGPGTDSLSAPAGTLSAPALGVCHPSPAPLPHPCRRATGLPALLGRPAGRAGRVTQAGRQCCWPAAGLPAGAIPQGLQTLRSTCRAKSGWGTEAGLGGAVLPPPRIVAPLRRHVLQVPPLECAREGCSCHLPTLGPWVPPIPAHAVVPRSDCLPRILYRHPVLSQPLSPPRCQPLVISWNGPSLGMASLDSHVPREVTESPPTGDRGPRLPWLLLCL